MPLKIHTTDDPTSPSGAEPENTPVLELVPGSENSGGAPNPAQSSFLSNMRALFAEARLELEQGDVMDEGPLPPVGNTEGETI